MKKKSLNAKKIILKHLNNNQISIIYNKFEKSLDSNEKYAVALSGGPDSLALAFLAKCYALKHGTNIKYLIVDHKLRKESSIEAEHVSLMLKKYSINCKILKWKGKKPKSNIQSIARNIRYSLLTNECKISKIRKLLVGHHMDDLHENFLIRLVRGSGLKGLISMDKTSELKINNIEIVRPLIDIEKKHLQSLSLKVYKKYIEDPSNQNKDFKRIRIRKLLRDLEIEGLDKKKLQLTINNLKDTYKSVIFYTNKNIKENCVYSLKDNKYILSSKFFEQSDEIIFRSIMDLLKKVSSKYYPPRGKSVKELILAINLNNQLKTTLGGCLIEKVNRTVIISPEKPQKKQN